MDVQKAVVFLLFLCIASQTKAQGNCTNGFSGPSCAVCNSDAACVASTTNQNATCSSSLVFASNSVVKSYICNPTAPSIVTGLIEPNSLLIQCHTGVTPTSSSSLSPATAPSSISGAPPSSLSPPSSIVSSRPPSVSQPPPTSPVTAPSTPVIVNGTDLSGLLNAAGQALGKRKLLQTGNSPFCTISFQAISPAITVGCTANNCALQLDTSKVTCQNTTCQCEGDSTCGGSPLTAQLANSVNGKAELQCISADNITGNCTLSLEGLPLSQLDATCTASECLEPQNENSFNGTTNSTTPVISEPIVQSIPNLNTNPVIAAIPLMILTFVVLFVGTYTWINKSMWSNNHAVVITNTRDVGGDNDLQSNKKVSVLEFKDISVQVPMDLATLKKRHEALVVKALAGQASMHNTLAPQPTSETATNFFSWILPNRTKGVGLSKEEKEAAAVASKSRSLSSAAEFVSDLHGNLNQGMWAVIKDCSGIATAGEVVGVLGPSGCGKTTLLGSIAGSSLDLGSTAVVHGQVLIDGVPRRGRDVAYVPQADNLIPTLTAVECIRYSALLRLPRNTPITEIHTRVAMVMDELGLRHIAESPVGGAGRIRGISGGERRRVSIGMELVTDPSIIVLDEPTSGLDSYTAINLVRSLRQVAAGGRVVIASLHQPSKDMFFALDRVILMGHGRMLFNGRPEEVEGALEAAGVSVPSNTAVAEHMLKVASSPEDIKAMLELPGIKMDKTSDGIDNVIGSRPASGVSESASKQSPSPPPPRMPVVSDQDALESASPPDHRALASAPTPLPPRHDGNAPNNPTNLTGTIQVEPSKTAINSLTTVSSTSHMSASSTAYRKAGFARQLAVMFWRTFVDIMRNPTLLLLHVCIATAVGVINGAIFWKVSDDFSGVQNRMGGTFFALAFLAFTSLTTVDLLMNERNVVMREVRAGYYRPISYLLSKLALDGMLLRVIPAVLFWAPFYYMAGFRTGSPYAATYVFALIAFNCTVGALSMAVTIGSNTAGQAAFIMNFTLLFCLAFTGFLVNIASIPAFLRWIHYLSPFFYAFEAMMATELDGQQFTFRYQLTPTSPALEVPNVPGEAFLTSLGLGTSSITEDLGILVALYGCCLLVALLLFLLKMPRTLHRRKRSVPR